MHSLFAPAPRNAFDPVEIVEDSRVNTRKTTATEDAVGCDANQMIMDMTPPTTGKIQLKWPARIALTRIAI